MKLNQLRFDREADKEFVLELRQRVKKYFNEKGINRYGNPGMWWKTFFMLLLYFVPYFIMLSGFSSQFLVLLGLWLLMGLGMAGIGLSVMHDANHRAYSKNNRVNNILGYFLNLVGGHSLNWKIQHNILHHGFTNVEGYDEDIDAGKVLRLSPHKTRLKIHRWQHLYAWPLYGLMTLTWVISKDFKDIFRYREMGLGALAGGSFRRMFTELLIWKLLYFFYTIVLPILLLPVPWWYIPILFFAAHFVCGFILATIFQTAHVMPTSRYPQPDNHDNIQNNWAVHQLQTTTNYSPKSRWFSWFIGGLNYQIEHHLFPNICHVHYKKISSIVQKTARDYNLPYNVQPTFLIALQQHGQMLRKLGKQPA